MQHFKGASRGRTAILRSSPAAARTLFLHVFEIAGEDDRVPVEVKLVEPAGVDIGGTWKVRFRAEGPLGGTVGDVDLAASVKTEGQYR
jgi:hypothetical protein